MSLQHLTTMLAVLTPTRAVTPIQLALRVLAASEIHRAVPREQRERRAQAERPQWGAPRMLAGHRARRPRAERRAQAVPRQPVARQRQVAIERREGSSPRADLSPRVVERQADLSPRAEERQADLSPRAEERRAASSPREAVETTLAEPQPEVAPREAIHQRVAGHLLEVHQPLVELRLLAERRPPAE